MQLLALIFVGLLRSKTINHMTQSLALIALGIVAALRRFRWTAVLVCAGLLVGLGYYVAGLV